MSTADLIWDTEPVLDRPVLVAAFAGYFDAATASTGAIDWLIEHHGATPFARIDPDDLFDFQQIRPQVELEAGLTRRITWPENIVHATDRSGDGRDLVLLSGTEPHFRWRGFCDALLEVARRTGCEMVVTLGATPEAVPHTRMPVVFGSSSDTELAARLGLSRPQYEGITGALGVLHAELDGTRFPAIAMRVAVPYYAGATHNPKASMALLRHLEHVTGVATSHADLAPAIAEWEQRLDDAVADDEQARRYLPQLEARYDGQAEDQIPSPDDLAAELERFLQERRDDQL